ncbi:unnamed protein product [Camellia sinensis]
MIFPGIWHETLQERSLSRMAFRGSALPCGVEHKYKLAIVDYFDGNIFNIINIIKHQQHHQTSQHHQHCEHHQHLQHHQTSTTSSTSSNNNNIIKTSSTSSTINYINIIKHLQSSASNPILDLSRNPINGQRVLLGLQASDGGGVRSFCQRHNINYISIINIINVSNPLHHIPS